MELDSLKILEKKNRQKAQTPLEYLLIIAGAILVVVIVLGLMQSLVRENEDVGNARALNTLCFPASSESECNVWDPDGANTKYTTNNCFWNTTAAQCLGDVRACRGPVYNDPAQCGAAGCPAACVGAGCSWSAATAKCTPS